jgi:hypothetical protein
VVARRSSGHHATDAGAVSGNEAIDSSECAHACRYRPRRYSRLSSGLAHMSPFSQTEPSSSHGSATGAGRPTEAPR